MNLESTDLMYSIIWSTRNSFERTSGATIKYVAQLSCGPFLGQYANAMRLISLANSSFSSESITGIGAKPMSALHLDSASRVSEINFCSFRLLGSPRSVRQ